MFSPDSKNNVYAPKLNCGSLIHNKNLGIENLILCKITSLSYWKKT